MAAGLGFKDFTTGEVLTAADVDGYLMQGIWVFASTAARDAAVTAPAEGNFAFTKDTNSLWYYDGAAWVASGATGDIEGVTAGVGISGGGTSGTVTITNDMATTITASGDIVVGTGSGTYDNLPIGTTGQLLTADTTVSPYKVKWATPAASANGLTLVKTQTIGTTVSSVTVSDAFSSTYDNYLITVSSGVGSSVGANCQMTLGSTTTGYYYAGAYMSYSSATVNGYNVSNGASWQATYVGTSANSGIINLQSPYLSKVTTFTSVQAGTSSGATMVEFTGFLDNTTSYTAFTLTPNTGTLTGGLIRVYGYQNS